jgi:hypothetical protein
VEHDITTAPTVVEHDITDVVATAHDITDVAAPERDSTATPAAASDGHAPRPVSYVSVPPNVWALARAVAVVLDETMPPPIRVITRAVDRLDPERARAVLGHALTVAAQGGLTLPDGRRRTLGGVFFHLVRASDEISREDKDDIFPREGGHPKRAGGSGTAAAPAPAAPTPVAWTDATFRSLARQLQQDPGRATTVKIIVIGRPGAVVEQGQAVALALVNEKVPDLPKGLPEPAAGTRYTVFVARKQWAKVAEALAADPEDTAIIEGYAALDARVEGIAVYATSATTKRLQAAKRAATP